MIGSSAKATMNPITNKPSSVESTSGSYPEKAMRAIRALHKQMRELGKQIQDETSSPTGSGPEQDQLMRDLMQQMNSIRMELEVLQASIIQHQALAALKKEQANERLNPQPSPAAPSPLPIEPNGTAATGKADQGQGEKRARADKTSVAGTLIDTTA